MRDAATGICSECKSPPEAYHRKDCSQFKGYHCWVHDRDFWDDWCPECNDPFSATIITPA